MSTCVSREPEVFNTYNESRGRFYKKHAKKRVAELNQCYKQIAKEQPK